jgi:Bacterial regulatory proteins, gntR family
LPWSRGLAADVQDGFGDPGRGVAVCLLECLPGFGAAGAVPVPVGDVPGTSDGGEQSRGAGGDRGGGQPRGRGALADAGDGGAAGGGEGQLAGADGLSEKGQILPSVRTLMQTYDISDGTVKRALRQLRDEGLIITYQGRGSFVA